MNLSATMARKPAGILTPVGSLIILSFSAIFFVSGLVFYIKSGPSPSQRGLSVLEAIEEDCRRDEEKANTETFVEWGKPFTIPGSGTKFLVTMKDAWYTDERCDEGKRKFYVTFSFRNLGPREDLFSLSNLCGSEVITNEGHIFGGIESTTSHSGRIVYGDWEQKEFDRSLGVNRTGENAIYFDVPKDSTPVEMTVKRKFGILRFKLPEPPFETRERFYIDRFSKERQKLLSWQ